MTKFINSLFFGLLCLILFSCSNIADNDEIQLLSGDLLFCPAVQDSGSDFSDAINIVTRQSKSDNYTHIGIVKAIDNDFFVIHSTPEKGVVKEFLNDFLEDYPNPHIYRLKADFSHCIQDALQKAVSFLGNPYDHSFKMETGAQYCSGLIYNIFKDCEIFELEPMSFKNPDTGETADFWIRYYQNLNEEIPEGLPGCNPNGLSRNLSVFKVGEYGL